MHTRKIFHSDQFICPKMTVPVSADLSQVTVSSSQAHQFPEWLIWMQFPPNHQTGSLQQTESEL